ncbi:hypothetical protein OF83DRAFT_1061007 [Amylostereum chailletii]|nr:hypothetical protein OF83DRAFT_1061007 [Amylostereum chailletii]
MSAPSIFSQLPVELVRDVFELAAHTHRPTACALSLVCSHSRAWIEPVLYRTVVLESARALRAFSSTLALKPASFDRIHHLGIVAPGPFPSIHDVLSACAGVSSLACGFSLASYAKQYPTSTPAFAAREQHLLGQSCRDGWDDAFLSAPATHLRIHLGPDNWDELSSARLRPLSHLTHLAVIFPVTAHAPPPESIYSMLLTLLDDLPLHVLLVQALGGARAAPLIEHLEREAQDRGEPRLVAEGAPLSAVRQWEDASRGGLGVWERADERVASRRRADALSRENPV